MTRDSSFFGIRRRRQRLYPGLETQRRGRFHLRALETFGALTVGFGLSC